MYSALNIPRRCFLHSYLQGLIIQDILAHANRLGSSVGATLQTCWVVWKSNAWIATALRSWSAAAGRWWRWRAICLPIEAIWSAKYAVCRIVRVNRRLGHGHKVFVAFANRSLAPAGVETANLPIHHFIVIIGEF